MEKNKRISFDRDQRIWIQKRDSHTCQMPNCNSKEKLQTHHIVPRSFAFNELHWSVEKINNPLNGIVLCRSCHKKIHTGKMEKKKIYWNTEFDDYLKKVALKNTLAFIEKNKKITEVFNIKLIQISTQALH